MDVYQLWPVVAANQVETPLVGINTFLDADDNNAPKAIDAEGRTIVFGTSEQPFILGSIDEPVEIISGGTGIGAFVTDTDSDDGAHPSTAAYFSILADGNAGGEGPVNTAVSTYGFAHSGNEAEIANLYGGFFYARSLVGGLVAENQIGVYGAVDIRISDEADQPQHMVAGVMGTYTSAATGSSDFLTGFKAAVAAVVWNTVDTTPDAAFFAWSGGPLEVEGGQIAAAFKAVSKVDGRFTYGLDLYNELSTELTTVRTCVYDIRLTTGVLILSGEGAPDAIEAPVGSVYFRTDATGEDDVMYVSVPDAEGNQWVAATLSV